MEDSTGAAGRADDPRDPRVVLFEQLLQRTQVVMITGDSDHEYVGVAIDNDGHTATAQSYFAMDLVERLANELGITS
jgi:hypothetical protein